MEFNIIPNNIRVQTCIKTNSNASYKIHQSSISTKTGFFYRHLNKNISCCHTNITFMLSCTAFQPWPLRTAYALNSFFKLKLCWRVSPYGIVYWLYKTYMMTTNHLIKKAKREKCTKSFDLSFYLCFIQCSNMPLIVHCKVNTSVIFAFFFLRENNKNNTSSKDSIDSTGMQDLFHARVK